MNRNTNTKTFKKKLDFLKQDINSWQFEIIQIKRYILKTFLVTIVRKKRSFVKKGDFMKQGLCWQKMVCYVTVVFLMMIIFEGCGGGDDNDKSPTTPQSGIDATGTWNIAYTVTSNTCDYGGDPGESASMILTVVQNDTQIFIADYPDSTGTIDPNTGEFTLTASVSTFTITLNGVTDGSTMNGTYVNSSFRIDNHEPCIIQYNFIGIKSI